MSEVRKGRQLQFLKNLCHYTPVSAESVNTGQQKLETY